MSEPPAAAAELVAYQPDAIVSRKLLAAPGGNITAFAFAAGQELSEHSTPYDALVLVVDGRARVRVGDTTHEVGTGELLRLPAGVPHAVSAPVPFKMLLTMIRS